MLLNIVLEKSNIWIRYVNKYSHMIMCVIKYFIIFCMVYSSIVIFLEIKCNVKVFLHILLELKATSPKVVIVHYINYTYLIFSCPMFEYIFYII